jgi:hypothetical protein
MDANSWPPAKGASMNTTTIANVAADIAGGEFKIETKWGGMSVSTVTGDLCDYRQDAAGNNMPCPISAGQGVQWANGGVFPTNAPNGSYEMTTSATDANGKTVMCYVNKFKV